MSLTLWPQDMIPVCESDRFAYSDFPYESEGEQKLHEDEENLGRTKAIRFEDKLSRDMMRMFRDGSFNDVRIKCHDGEVSANKSVLAARSEYFAATFRWKNNNNHDVKEIVVNDCSKKIMTRMLEYLFSGVMKVNDLSLLELLELKDQARRILPGDELGELIKGYLYKPDQFTTDNRDCDKFFPTQEDIVNALSLVESGNIPTQVIKEAVDALLWAGKYGCCPQQVTALASLAYRGICESLEYLRLWNSVLEDPSRSSNHRTESLDLGSVPDGHLQALVRCVTGDVQIINLANCDMSALLDCVNSRELLLSQKLNQEETEALVRAMTSRVEVVHLGDQYGCGDVQFDVETITKYRGDGKCRAIRWKWNWSPSLKRWIGRMDLENTEWWAREMNWSIKIQKTDEDEDGGTSSNEQIYAIVLKTKRLN